MGFGAIVFGEYRFGEFRPVPSGFKPRPIRGFYSDNKPLRGFYSSPKPKLSFRTRV